MERKYNIGNKYLFVPKNGTLSKVEQPEQINILGANETRLLNTLISNSHRTLHRKELISELWNNRDIFVDNSSLTQCVSTLRKALEDSTTFPVFIKTVPKQGYEFIASVEAIGEPVPIAPIIEVETEAISEVAKVSQAKGLVSPHSLVLLNFLLRFEVFVIVLVFCLVIELMMQ